MLPWEEHAKRGMYFFSWKGGFVCTGPDPNPPDEWVTDVYRVPDLILPLKRKTEKRFGILKILIFHMLMMGFHRVMVTLSYLSKRSGGGYRI